MTLNNEFLFVLHLLACGGLLLVAARQGRVGLGTVVVTCTILMNIVVMKQFTVFGLSVTGGNVLFATVFLANDVLNEHFGKKAARSAVYLGFAASLGVVIVGQFELLYVPNSVDDAQPHLEYFFAAQAYPRIVLASMGSYLASQLLDTQIYHFIRGQTGTQRLLWLRSNASTWISQAFDTVFFTTAALTGPDSVISSWPEWRDAVVFTYLIKLIAAAGSTPFLYLTTWRPFVPAGSRRQSAA